MKAVPIEKLLRWAYRDELPREEARPGFLRPDGFRSPGANLVRTGDLGLPIQEPDIRNKYGMVPDLTAHSQPHADAIRIWQAVQDLNDMNLGIAEDWYPIADLGDLGHYGEAAVTRAIRRLCFRSATYAVSQSVKQSVRHWRVTVPEGGLMLRKPASEVIQKYAILGGEPSWQSDVPPKFCTVSHANGQPRWFMIDTIQTERGPVEVEVDGMNKKSHLPNPDAYLKHFYDPDPADLVEARAEYAIWHSALQILAEQLAGRLDDHETVATTLPAEPWETGAAEVPRVLKDSHTPQPGIAKREQRPVVLRPLPRGQHGPVKLIFARQPKPVDCQV